MDEAGRPEVENLPQRIALLLTDTSRLLPAEVDTEWFDEVMGTEQFELAFDELVRLGDEHRPPSGYWGNLTSVAAMLGLSERIASLRARAER